MYQCSPEKSSGSSTKHALPVLCAGTDPGGWGIRILDRLRAYVTDTLRSHTALFSFDFTDKCSGIHNLDAVVVFEVA
jgi:hypothetical protein